MTKIRSLHIFTIHLIYLRSLNKIGPVVAMIQCTQKKKLQTKTQTDKRTDQ